MKSFLTEPISACRRMAASLLRLQRATLLFGLMPGLLFPGFVHAVDWDSVPKTTQTLFYPGQYSFEWILTMHPAAKSVRAGKTCRGCHRGAEAELGAAIWNKVPPRAPDLPGSLDVEVQLFQDTENLYIRIGFDAPPDGGRVTIMSNNGASRPFQATGCWATCHRDLPGMDGSGEVADKYLSIAKSKTGSFKTDGELEEMKRRGAYVTYASVSLSKGKVSRVRNGHLLRDWGQTDPFYEADGGYKDGTWTIILSRPIVGDGLHQTIEADRVYTMGLAIHSAKSRDREHLTSLPFTISIKGRSDLHIAQ